MEEFPVPKTPREALYYALAIGMTACFAFLMSIMKGRSERLSAALPPPAAPDLSARLVADIGQAVRDTFHADDQNKRLLVENNALIKENNGLLKEAIPLLRQNGETLRQNGDGINDLKVEVEVARRTTENALGDVKRFVEGIGSILRHLPGQESRR